MFFFIGGIGPRTIILDRRPDACPRCGRHTQCLKRTDQWISLFFVPLFPVKKGEPFLSCERCGGTGHERGGGGSWRRFTEEKACRHCGRKIDADFDYCPSCGNQLGNR